MNYTPLGYLQLGPLSASLLTVPVAIGAMTMGPLAGAILGGIFGATSFIQMVEGKSAMGAALFSVNPFGAFVVSFVARVLEGLCAALIFNALRKAMPKKEKLCCVIGAICTPVLNTVFFMGFLVLFFYNCDYVQNLAGGRAGRHRVADLRRGGQCRHPAGAQVSETELRTYPKASPKTGVPFLHAICQTGPIKKM